MIVAEPSEVSRVTAPLAAFSTQRSFPETYATRVASGESLANISEASGREAPIRWSAPLPTSSSQ